MIVRDGPRVASLRSALTSTPLDHFRTCLFFSSIYVIMELMLSSLNATDGGPLNSLDLVFFPLFRSSSPKSLDHLS